MNSPSYVHKNEQTAFTPNAVNADIDVPQDGRSRPQEEASTHPKATVERNWSVASFVEATTFMYSNAPLSNRGYAKDVVEVCNQYT